MSRITIHRVGRREPGEANVGCGPNDIQICYKEETWRGGEIGFNFSYIEKVLAGAG